MKRALVVLVGWGVEIFAFQRWFACWLFKENFYFTPSNLTTQIINATNADKGMPLFVIRALHNKVLGLGWGLSQSLLQYWDIRFLEEFIGIIGAIGVGFGIWYFFTKRRKNYFLWIVFLLGMILPIIEMFFQPHIQYAWVLYIFGFIFQALSLYGLWNFLKKGTIWRYLFIIFLIVMSVLMLLLFPLAYQNFCIKI